MGVRVGVLVGVGVALGSGVAVDVGDGVLVGAMVALAVRVGEGVQVSTSSGMNGAWQAVVSQDRTNSQIKDEAVCLIRDGKEGVVIINFPVIDSKGVIAISHKSLGRCGSPGEMT